MVIPIYVGVLLAYLGTADKVPFNGVCSQKKGVSGLDGDSNSIPLEVISPRSVAAAMA